jgi:hypothetical protein
MIDPAGITQRGAERSAPRSRSGPSGTDSHGIAPAAAHLVTTCATEKAAVVLHGDPPHAGHKVERRLTIAKHDTLDLLSSRSRCAVERGLQWKDRMGVAARRVGRMSTELCAQRGRASSRAIACLTSARGARDTAHEGVVVAGVRRCPPVGTGELSGVPVERVTLDLERAIQ